MATKQLYATGTFKYNNRMMQAGDQVEMTAPHARLYGALGKVTDKRPRAPKPVAAAETAPVAKPKRAPRKAKAKK